MLQRLLLVEDVGARRVLSGCGRGGLGFEAGGIINSPKVRAGGGNEVGGKVGRGEGSRKTGLKEGFSHLVLLRASGAQVCLKGA